MTNAFSKQSVSAELAHRLIEAAERHATQMGHAFAIAIVDESGVLKAFSRMDGAPLLSVQVAQDKAYTATGFGMATDAWHEFIKNDPPLAAGAPAGVCGTSGGRGFHSEAGASVFDREFCDRHRRQRVGRHRGVVRQQHLIAFLPRPNDAGIDVCASR